MSGHIGLPIILSQFKEASLEKTCLARLTEVTSADYMETDIPTVYSMRPMASTVTHVCKYT